MKKDKSEFKVIRSMVDVYPNLLLHMKEGVHRVSRKDFKHGSLWIDVFFKKETGSVDHVKMWADAEVANFLNPKLKANYDKNAYVNKHKCLVWRFKKDDYVARVHRTLAILNGAYILHERLR